MATPVGVEEQPQPHARAPKHRQGVRLFRYAFRWRLALEEIRAIGPRGRRFSDTYDNLHAHQGGFTWRELSWGNGLCLHQPAYAVDYLETVVQTTRKSPFHATRVAAMMRCGDGTAWANG
jgi:hypothetical protein